MSFLPTISSIFSPNTAYQTTITAVQYDEPAVDQTGDTVTISPEGLEAYRKIDAQPYEFQKFDIQPSKQQAPKPYAEAQQDLQNYRTEHSTHLDIDAWAFGGDSSGTSYVNSGVWWLQGFSNTAVTTVYSNAQTALESVDAKIGKLLKENNITLSQNEPLDLSVNQDGKITVGGNIGSSQRAAIEEALNSDKTLWRDMVSAHAFRRDADMTLTSPVTTRYALSNALVKQDVETILQREYGVSLDDFELNTDETPLGEVRLVIKSKTGNDALVRSLYDEEFALYESIAGVLKHSSSGEGIFDPNFNIGFSYKNGVTVEKGKTDQAGLDKVTDTMVGNPLSVTHDFSITVSGAGVITDVQTCEPKYQEATSRWITKMNVSSLQNSTYNPNNGYFNQPVLQQYVLDMQRLTKFNTGAEADWGQITFGKAGGTAFSVATAK